MEILGLGRVIGWILWIFAHPWTVQFLWDDEKLGHDGEEGEE